MELAELIKRVEGLTGAKPSVDLDAHMEICPDKYPPGWSWEDELRPPRLTASVDAVIQLVGEMMGTTEAEWYVGRPTVDGPYHAALRGHTSAPIDDVQGEAPTPALALLLAFLRAWEARGEKG